MSEETLPKLPGFTVRTVDPNTSYNKKNTLGFANGFRIAAHRPTPISTTTNTSSSSLPLNFNSFTLNTTTTKTSPPPPTRLPNWLTKQNQVLRFFSYFSEQVENSTSLAQETYRIRPVEILYYLEDDSLQVVEPRAKSDPNSGLITGTIVHRHRPTEEEDNTTTPMKDASFDIKLVTIGQIIKLFGRDYYVVDTDAFTRDYFKTEWQTDLPPPHPLPPNPIDEYRKMKSKPSGLTRTDVESPSRYMEALLGRASSSKKLQQFIEHNTEVLRFYCLWDDDDDDNSGTTMGGAEGTGNNNGAGTTTTTTTNNNNILPIQHKGVRHLLRLHYFLEDDTVEIVEEFGRNSGMGPFTTFLKRGPLPLISSSMASDSGSGGQSSSLPTTTTITTTTTSSSSSTNCRAEDLHIGKHLPVHGRSFLLYDADKFTKQWLKLHLGREDSQLVGVDISEPIHMPPTAPLPPHNGLGDPEDSLQSCLKLVPSPPKKDPRKMALYDGNTLQFSAKLSPPPPLLGGRGLTAVEKARRFVVTFYLATDEVSVYEQAGVGIPGGKFLEKKKVLKSTTNDNGNDESTKDKEPSSVSSSIWYQQSDFYPGAVLSLHGRYLELLEGDAWTQRYLSEKNDDGEVR